MESSKPYCLEAQGLNEEGLALWRALSGRMEVLDENEQPVPAAVLSVREAEGLHRLIKQLNDEAGRLRQCLAATCEDVLDVKHKGESVAILHFLKNCDEGSRQRLRELFADVPGCKAGELRRAVLPLFMEMKRQNFRTITLTIDGLGCHFSGQLEAEEAEGVIP